MSERFTAYHKQSAADFSKIMRQALDSEATDQILFIPKRLVQTGSPEEIAKSVAHRLAVGVNRAKLTTDITRKGMPAEEAAYLVERLGAALTELKHTPEVNHTINRKYLNQMGWGFFAFAVGLGITVYSFGHPSKSGTSFLWYGPVGIGTIVMVVAIIRWVNFRKQ